MITLTQQPPNIAALETEAKAPPVPVSECWRWCLQPDAGDAVTTPGGRAYVEVTFPSSPTDPGDGTEFTIWNNLFTVDSGAAFTGTSFRVEAGGAATRDNFANMLAANYYFNVAATVTESVGGGSFKVRATWRECREQPNFAAEHMDFAGVEATGATVAYANGTSPVYTDAHKIITRFGYYGDAGKALSWLNITEFTGLEADKRCTAVGGVCVDYPGDAQSQLYTDLPALTNTSFIAFAQGGQSLMRLFSIEFGWTFRLNCISQTGTIKKSGVVLGINAAFDVDDPYGMARYWYAHPQGLPPDQDQVRFLTTQPERIPICGAGFKWLWLTNNWQQEFPDYQLVAQFVAERKGLGDLFYNVVINKAGAAYGRWFQPLNFNASPGTLLANVPGLTPENFTGYSVSVNGFALGVDPDDFNTTEPIFQATETLRFTVTGCCDGDTDLYFLSPAGGIDTVLVNIENVDSVREGQEVNLQGDCAAPRLDRAKYGGRSLRALRNYKTVRFSVQGPRTREWEAWLADLHNSPQHWLRVKTADGYIARKLILSPGSTQTYNVAGGINFTAEGYLPDIPGQAGVEPF